WNRFENNYGFSRNLLKRIGLFDVEGHAGAVVKSDRKFHMFQKWFEGKFERSGRRIIDATEGGARKEHCDALPFRDVVNEYMSSKTHSDRVRLLSQVDTENEYPDKALVLVKSKLEEVLEEFYRLEKVGRKGKRLSEELCRVVEKCVKYKKPFSQRIGDIHFELDKIDRAITENTTINALISITIQNIINSGTEEDDSDISALEQESKELKVSKQTLRLYQGIVEGIEFNIEQFSRCLKRLNVPLGQDP
ncbi:MAG: hypothetical protein OEZ36_06310, partial [Spirochaetota bacterium]|nr:hypothetical protein [Spirochaetota bacterium]